MTLSTSSEKFALLLVRPKFGQLSATLSNETWRGRITVGIRIDVYNRNLRSPLGGARDNVAKTGSNTTATQDGILFVG